MITHRIVKTFCGTMYVFSTEQEAERFYEKNVSRPEEGRIACANGLYNAVILYKPQFFEKKERMYGIVRIDCKGKEQPTGYVYRKAWDACDQAARWEMDAPVKFSVVPVTKLSNTKTNQVRFEWETKNA